jgi:hypothetical protein
VTFLPSSNNSPLYFANAYSATDPFISLLEIMTQKNKAKAQTYSSNQNKTTVVNQYTLL